MKLKRHFRCWYFSIMILLHSSCAPDKKLAGTYLSTDGVIGFQKQIIHFTSDSTLQYVTIGRKYDSLKGYYRINSGMLLILFDIINYATKTILSHNDYPVRHLYPPYSSDSLYWQKSFDIHHHKLVETVVSFYKKKGYKYGEGNMWFKNNTLYKIE